MSFRPPGFFIIIIIICFYYGRYGRSKYVRTALLWLNSLVGSLEIKPAASFAGGRLVHSPRSRAIFGSISSRCSCKIINSQTRRLYIEYNIAKCSPRSRKNWNDVAGRHNVTKYHIHIYSGVFRISSRWRYILKNILLT